MVADLTLSLSHSCTLRRGLLSFHSSKFLWGKCFQFPVLGHKILFQCVHKARQGSQQTCSVAPVVNTPPELTRVTTAGSICVSMLLQTFFLSVFARRCFTGQPLMFKVSAPLSWVSPPPRTCQPNGPVAIACPVLHWSILGEEQEQ